MSNALGESVALGRTQTATQGEAIERALAYWRKRLQKSGMPQEIERRPAPVMATNQRIRAEYISYRASDGTKLKARYLEPRFTNQGPCIVVFHDANRSQRGWFHLARFVALGYAVFAPEMRPWSDDVTRGWCAGPDGLEFAQLIDDACTACFLAAKQSFCAQEGLFAWGEGLGGALAIDVAALTSNSVPIVACAALNPAAANWRLLWEAGAEGVLAQGLHHYFRLSDPSAQTADALFNTLSYTDTRLFAKRVSQPTLVGCSLMDTEALPSATGEVVVALGDHGHCVNYPKYAHERVNDFENKLLSFMHHELRQKR